MNKLKKVGVGDEKSSMHDDNCDNVGDIVRISALGGTACGVAGGKGISAGRR